MQENKTSANTRNLWIDLVKLIAIINVVYIHCPPADFNIVSFWFIFFFMSGLLFSFDKYDSFIGFVKRRSKQILVPYFCFFLFFYLFWLFVGKNLSSPEEQALPFYTPILEYLYGRPNSVCLPLWFLACLFAVQSLFYIFKKLNKIITVIILLLLPFLNILFDLSNTPWMLDGVCEYFPYFGIPCLFKKEFFNFMENKKRFGLSFILLIICILSNWIISDISNMILKTALIMLRNFSLLVFLIVLMKLITDKFGLHKSIKYLAINTIIILAFNSYAIRLVDIFIKNVSGFDSNFYEGNLIFKISLTFFVMISMYIPIYVINRYLPFIIGKGRLFETKK